MMTMMYSWNSGRCLAAIAIVIIAVFVSSVQPLANCPTGCKCDDKTLVVNCGEGHLDVLPIALNPSIQRLVIKNNKIKTIDSSIQFYGELIYLDLSINHLFNIPMKTFQFQSKLEELHLNHNKISSVSNKTFIGLQALTVLNLRGNFIDELGFRTFSSLPKLEELNLGQNRITRINPNAFDDLANLRVLMLDDNQLSIVPTIAMSPLNNLAELFLGLNSFATVQRGSFEMLKHLTRLDLKGAALYNISVEAFQGLENSLRQLDLSDNRLKRIPTVHLSGLARLEELSLGQNEFDVIPEGGLVGLKNLRRIDISGSLKLRKIQAGAFATNTNLEAITIAANKLLDEVQEGAFSGLPYLKHVVLRDNALRTLDEGLFPWSKLHTLDLSGNPIVCDCRMLWLHDLLIERNASQIGSESSAQQTRTIYCEAPERLRGEPLQAISQNLLGCVSSPARRQAMIGALLVGVAAMVTALALLLYRYRRQIRDLSKDNSWTRTNSFGSKEREYQKSYYDEASFISRHTYSQAASQFPCSLAAHPATLNHYSYYTPINRPQLPITEL